MGACWRSGRTYSGIFLGVCDNRQCGWEVFERPTFLSGVYIVVEGDAVIVHSSACVD